MTVTSNLPELALRSSDAYWNRERWEQLPDDGNRYEVIDGVLYRITAPSNFHQWIIRQIVRRLFQQIDEADLRVKRGAYARAEVPEYWIVRPASRDVLVCTQPDITMGDYAQVQHVAPDAELISPTLPFRALVADFFAGAPDTTL